MSARQRQPESARPEGQEFEPFLDRQEVARRFQIGSRDLAEWLKNGVLPHFRIGGKIRFRWSEIEDHLNRHCRVPAVPPREDRT
ncbi:MAG: helix-turn-helix domain-containing protein [Verrucomicrobiales bacterium]|nr:helix-turn-helix domain-containing protein [Verrucomicrobiales bacterium]